MSSNQSLRDFRGRKIAFAAKNGLKIRNVEFSSYKTATVEAGRKRRTMEMGIVGAPMDSERKFPVTCGKRMKQPDWTDRQEMTWNEICARLTAHKEGSKDGACVVPGILSHPKRQAEFVEEISLAVYDCDCGHTRQEIEARAKERGLAVCIYSTHSHMTTATKIARSEFEARKLTAEQYLLQVKKYLPRVAVGATATVNGDDVILSHEPCPKYRLVLRPDHSCKASDYDSQEAFCQAWRERYFAGAHYLDLTVDPACADPNRLFFLPRHGVGRPYDNCIIEGADLPLSGLPKAPEDAPAATEPKKSSSHTDRTNSDDHGIIRRFNRNFTVESQLEKYGYKKMGRKWLAPSSGTKEPGVSVRDGRAFSHHGSDPLFTGGMRGDHGHDAFGIFCIYEHADDSKAAVKAAARMLNIDPPKSGVNGHCDNWEYPEALTGAPAQNQTDAPVGPDAETSNDYLDRLNTKHAIIMVGGKCCILNEIVDPTFNRPDVTFSSISDFRNFYSNEKVFVKNGKGEQKAHSVAELWLQNKGRRQHQGIVFAPGKTVPGYYNLFRGFGVEPKKGDWSLNRNHQYEVICNCDEQADIYLTNWKASIVQSVYHGRDERPETSFVMKGKRGTGKGTDAQCFGGAFGSHFLHVTSPNQFLGKFNQHLKDCIVLFADEAFWAGDKTSEGILKGLVTEKTFRVEPKGKDSFVVKNHVNLIVASNNDWVIPAGLDERRFFVVEVSDTHQQDHKYFKALHDEMNNGGREAMLYDLLHTDLSGVNLRNIPQTAGLMEQKLLSADSITKFWFSRLQEGSQLREDGGWQPYAETQKLFDQYAAYARTLGYSRIEDAALFSRKLRELCPPEGGSVGISGPRRFSQNGRRINVLEFPKLSVCRRKFETVSKYPVQWDETDE